MSHETSALRNLDDHNSNTYCCIPCGHNFHSHFDFTLHLMSDEHDNMVLATGEQVNHIPAIGEPDMIRGTGEYVRIPFAGEYGRIRGELVNSNLNNFGGFPPLYYCVLCNVSCFTYKDHYDVHLKSSFHIKMADFMWYIYFRSTRNNVNIDTGDSSASSIETYSVPHHEQKIENYCEICEIQCGGKKKYKRHLKSKLHVRKKEFMTKMLNRKTKWSLYASDYGEASGMPRSSMFYCELCNILFHGFFTYIKHLDCSIHKRILLLMGKISPRIDENVVDAFSDTQASANDSVSPVHYCAICNKWISGATVQYEAHLGY